MSRFVPVNAAHLVLVGLAHNLLTTMAYVANTASRPFASHSTGSIRDRLLRVPRRLVTSARRAVLVVNETLAAWWTRVLARLQRLAVA